MVEGARGWGGMGGVVERIAEPLGFLRSAKKKPVIGTPLDFSRQSNKPAYFSLKSRTDALKRCMCMYAYARTRTDTHAHECVFVYICVYAHRHACDKYAFLVLLGGIW